MLFSLLGSAFCDMISTSHDFYGSVTNMCYRPWGLMEQVTGIEMVEENRVIVEDYFIAVNAGDIARLGTLFSDDVVWHQPGAGVLSGTYQGKDEVFGLFRIFGEMSNGTFEIDDVEAIMGNGDLVSAIVHFRAERGGENMSMRGVDVMRIEDGKIKEVWLFSENQEDEDIFWGT